MPTVQVRYIVDVVDRAIEFYTRQLGFTLVMHPAPPFAMLSRGDLRLVLSAPNPSGGGGQAMPDGTMPQPGGWNRFAIQVEDLAAMVQTLRAAGARFRNDIVTGVGGRQIPSRIRRAIRSSCSSRQFLRRAWTNVRSAKAVALR